jgi:hypothetical protein
MKLKKYLQFIKESLNKDSMYWINEDQIKDIFQYIIDEEYILSITRVFFGYYGYSNNELYDKEDKLITFDTTDGDDVILSGKSYYPGYKITIIKSQYKGSDVTDEFQSAISQLKGEGYIVNVEDDDGKTNLENIHLDKGSIITWIPEKPNKPFTKNQDEMSDGDLYISSNALTLLVHQSEEIKLNNKILADIYGWKYDKIEGDTIYCDVSIDNMAAAILSKSANGRWGNSLKNGGIDMDNYYGDGYYPDINSVFDYNLNKENSILMVKSLIKEISGLESAIEYLKDEDIYESLKGKSEDEFINIVLKERFKKCLNKLGEDSEIMSSIRECISDWKRQAHCDQNFEDLMEEFDKIVSKVTEYTKFYREINKHYLKKDPLTDSLRRVSYKENVLHYQIPFQEKWILDYGKALKGYSLDSLFIEWCSDEYLDYRLEPHFKDCGDIDEVELKKEISGILNSYS